MPLHAVVKCHTPFASSPKWDFRQTPGVQTKQPNPHAHLSFSSTLPSIYMRILFPRLSCSTRAPLSSLHAVTCSSGLKHKKESVVVIMGATGTGKSRLSIDVASTFPSEVVNADKIQLYRGLDITTNKIPLSDRRGVPHHLIGDLDPAAGELTPAGFRSLAASAVADIASRRRLPVVAGGSNSFIHALLSDRYEPGSDPFRHRVEPTLRYRCCFLWVDVARTVLMEYLNRRVEEMVGMGMVEELEEYFAAGEAVRCHAGLGKAIGLPEFRGYFGKGKRGSRKKFEEAVEAIKENTRRLAERQVWKIKRLRESGWALHRLDATEAIRAKLRGEGEEAEEAWERDVVGPSFVDVERFLGDKACLHSPLLSVS